MKFEMGYVGATTYMQFNVRLEQAACGGRGALDSGRHLVWGQTLWREYEQTYPIDLHLRQYKLCIHFTYWVLAL